MNNKLYILLLGALLVLHIATNIVWLSVNNAPPSWDEASHAWISLNIADNLSKFDFAGVLKSSDYYPIFIHTISALILLLTNNMRYAQFVGTIFLVIAVVFLYLYVLRLYKSARLAFFSASLFSFFPIIFDQSRRLMLDVPLTAVFLISLYLLEKSENLTKTKTSILFFISLGLLFMTKWTGVFFLIVPLGFSLVSSIKTGTYVAALKNSLIGLPFLLIIALPWYFINFHNLYLLSQVTLQGYADQPNLWSFGNLIYYLKLFVNLQATPLLAAVFLFSLFYLGYYRHKNLLLSTTFGSYLFFTFVSNKDPRYLMPLLPLVAIILAVFFNKLDKKYKFTSIGFFIYLFLYFILLSVRPVPLENFKISMHLPLFDWINVVDVSDTLARRYDKRTWNIGSIIKDIEKESKNKPSKTIVAVENEHLNPSTLNLYLKILGDEKNVKFITPDIYFLLDKYSQPLFPSEKAIINYINGADFLLISPLNLGSQYLRNKEALTQLQHYFIGDALLPCAEFERKVAPKNTTCFVRMGEVIETISDIRINDSPDDKVGRKTLSGFTKIRCPYACSFRQIRPPKKRFNIDIVKEYTFPNGLRLNLYKV